MKFNLIGAGRLGTSLASALIQRGGSELVGVYSPRLLSAQHLLKIAGTGHVIPALEALPEADCTFITAPDDRIQAIAQSLASHARSSNPQIVVHCSGLLSSNVFEALQAKGWHAASIHPLRAFHRGSDDPDILQGCYCAAEGDALALQVLSPVFQQLGAHLVILQANAKARYHAAAVMASNYTVTLAAIASELLTETGLKEQQANDLILNLMQSTLKNLAVSAHFKDALSGPLVRGDDATIAEHLAALTNPTTHALYCSAALATLPLLKVDSTVFCKLKSLLSRV